MNDPNFKGSLKYMDLPDPNSVKLEDLQTETEKPNQKVSMAMQLIQQQENTKKPKQRQLVKKEKMILRNE